MENKKETINEKIERDIKSRKEIIEKNGKGGYTNWLKEKYGLKPVFGNLFTLEECGKISGKKDSIDATFTRPTDKHKGIDNPFYYALLSYGSAKVISKYDNKKTDDIYLFDFDIDENENDIVIEGDRYQGQEWKTLEIFAKEQDYEILSLEELSQLSTEGRKSKAIAIGKGSSNAKKKIYTIENGQIECTEISMGSWLITSEGVVDINTVQSINFRHEFIEYCKTLEQATIVAKDAIESGTKIIAEAASNAKGFMVKCLDDVKNFISASAVFNTFSGLKYSDSYFINIITLLDNQANEIQDEIKKKKRSLKLEDDLDPYQELVIDQEIDRLIFERNQFMQYRNEIADQRSQSLKDKREKINDKSYTTTDVLKEYIRINPNTSFTNVNMVNAMLKDKGILVKQGQWKLNPNNHWAARSAILGLFPDGNTQITIHWNELGKDLIMRLLAYEDGFRILLGGNGINISSNRIIDGDTSDDELLTILTYRDYKLRVNGKAV